MPAITLPATSPIETWSQAKPPVTGRHGVVASQNVQASEVGAAVLAAGGNAADAAVATALALTVAEPWMSGLGGGGFMLVRLRGQAETQVVDFGMRAPLALDPADYPTIAGIDDDLFGWPAVVEDRNLVGPLSFAVPGFVAGHALALERFGTRSWSEALAPAIALAERGMDIDWYATLKIAAEAKALARYPESARTYLPDGLPPAASWATPRSQIHLKPVTVSPLFAP